MLNLKHVTLTKASFALLLCLVVVILPHRARADDLTGQSQDDPKDLIPASAPARPQNTGLAGFQPMPAWARGVVLSPLPDKLKPMGKKIEVLTTPPTPAPNSTTLAPPPDASAAVADTTAKAKTNPAPADNNPDLIAVSPFLQWIKANPQAAAAEARQQANSYHASSSPDAAPSTGASGADNAAHAAATAPAEAPYWLPPLIDSGDFGSKPVTGSAAIYQTPQR